MYSSIQLFITEDNNGHFTQRYNHLRNVLFNLLDTPVKSTHHIGGTRHFMYPTEPILDILVGVNNLHDVTSLDEKRLNYEGFYRLHHPYKKKVVMAQFNNLIELKQTTQLHIIQKDTPLYTDYLEMDELLASNSVIAKHFSNKKQCLASHKVTIILDYENHKQMLFQQLTKQKDHKSLLK